MGMNLNLKTTPKTAPPAADDFVPSELWANIGYWDVIDGERTFISLAKGVPLDALKPSRGNGEVTKRKNRLGAMLQEAAQSLEPGEAQDVMELVVQLRRTAEVAEDEGEAIDSTLRKLTFAPRVVV